MLPLEEMDAFILKYNHHNHGHTQQTQKLLKVHWEPADPLPGCAHGTSAYGEGLAGANSSFSNVIVTS